MFGPGWDKRINWFLLCKKSYKKLWSWLRLLYFVLFFFLSSRVKSNLWENVNILHLLSRILRSVLRLWQCNQHYAIRITYFINSRVWRFDGRSVHGKTEKCFKNSVDFVLFLVSFILLLVLCWLTMSWKNFLLITLFINLYFAFLPLQNSWQYDEQWLTLCLIDQKRAIKSPDTLSNEQKAVQNARQY